MLIRYKIGKIVNINDAKTISDFWKGKYCFGIILANQRPIETAKAPMNNPIIMLLTPSHDAPTAAAPAPAVQRGQCAETNSVKEVMVKNKVMTNKGIFGPKFFVLKFLDILS